MSIQYLRYKYSCTGVTIQSQIEVQPPHMDAIPFPIPQNVSKKTVWSLQFAWLIMYECVPYG